MTSRNTIKRQRHELMIHQKRRCCYCECKLVPVNTQKDGVVHPRSATIEHLRRKAEGGSNAIGNKAVACHECNTGRGSIDWLTYKSLKMGELAA